MTTILKQEKDMIKKYRKGISDIVRNIGWTTIANKIPSMKFSELEKNVKFIINKEVSVGKGCMYLTNPVTRVKTKNPMRPKYLKAKKYMFEALKRLKELEDNVKKYKK